MNKWSRFFKAKKNPRLLAGGSCLDFAQGSLSFGENVVYDSFEMFNNRKDGVSVIYSDIQSFTNERDFSFQHSREDVNLLERFLKNIRIFVTDRDVSNYGVLRFARFSVNDSFIGDFRNGATGYTVSNGAQFDVSASRDDGVCLCHGVSLPTVSGVNGLALDRCFFKALFEDVLSPIEATTTFLIEGIFFRRQRAARVSVLAGECWRFFWLPPQPPELYFPSQRQGNKFGEAGANGNFPVGMFAPLRAT